MADETVVAEGVTTETTTVVEPEEPKAEATEPAIEQDYKALYETERAAKERAEHNLQSAKGQLTPRLDIEAELRAVRREIKALAKGHIAGDPEVTERAFAEAEQQSQQETFQQEFNAQANSLVEQINEDMEDAGLTAASPELAEANRIWDEWLRTQSLSTLRQAAKITREARRGVQIAAWERDQAEAKKKSGALSTPGVRASGNGAQTGAALEKAVARGEILLTPAIQKQLEAYWNS